MPDYALADDKMALLCAIGEADPAKLLAHPYDNAKAESFMKTLKLKAVYPMACETFAHITRLSEPQTVRGPSRPADGHFQG